MSPVITVLVTGLFIATNTATTTSTTTGGMLTKRAGQELDLSAPNSQQQTAGERWEKAANSQLQEENRTFSPTVLDVLGATGGFIVGSVVVGSVVGRGARLSPTPVLGQSLRGTPAAGNNTPDSKTEDNGGTVLITLAVGAGIFLFVATMYAFSQAYAPAVH